jgi:hypothetical protein
MRSTPSPSRPCGPTHLSSCPGWRNCQSLTSRRFSYPRSARILFVIPGPRSGTRNPECQHWRIMHVRDIQQLDQGHRSGFRVPLRGPGMTRLSPFLSGDGKNIFLLYPRIWHLPHTRLAPSCPRVPLPSPRAVRAGRAHSQEANAPWGSQLPKAKCIEAERNGREPKSPDGRSEGRSIYLDWRLTGRPSSQLLNGQIGNEAWQW